MTAFLPQYRLSLLQPRTVDPAEASSSLLTPASTTVHGDPFLVATRSGIASSSGGTFQPYLGLIKGRRGRMDPLTKNTDVGEMTLEVLDKRAGAADDNLTRWLTWFFGDAAGLSRWMGLKGRIDEALDGGASSSSWTPYFTGRISDLRLDQSRLKYTLALRDASEDLQAPIFVGRPATNVLATTSTGSTGYAQTLSLLPVGFVRPFGLIRTQAGDQPLQALPLKGTRLNSFDVALNGVTRRLFAVRLDADQISRADNVITDQLYRSGAAFYNASIVTGPGWPVIDDTKQIGRVHITSSSGAYGEMVLVEVWHGEGKDGNGNLLRNPHTLFLADLPRRLATSTDPPDYILPTSSWGAVTCHAYVQSQWSTDVTILLDDAHPGQVWRDALDGYFGYLWDPAELLPSTAAFTAGTPLRRVAYSTALFDALVADKTYPPFRGVITTKDTLGPWAQKAILQNYQLGYYVDGSGQVCPVDLRQPTTPPSLTLTDADLDDKAVPSWEHSRDNIITRAQLTYYLDNASGSPAAAIAKGNITFAPNGFPIAASVLNSSPQQVKVPGLGSFAAGDKLVQVDGVGYRTLPNEVMGDSLNSFNPRPRADYLAAKMTEMVQAMATPFGAGAQTVSLTARRTTNTDAVQVGTLVSLQVSQVPDPRTHLRGGARLARCVERSEQGLTVVLKFLDLGYATALTAPALDAVVAVPGSSYHAAACAVTLAASAGGGYLAAEVHAAVSTSATIPSTSSVLWQLVAPVIPPSSVAAATKTVSNLPAGARVWLRGRSVPLSSMTAQLPSSWVPASSNGYADLTALAAPSGLGTSSITAYRAVALWTQGATDLWTEVFVAIPSTADTTLVERLTPSSAGRYVVNGLTPNSSVTVAVRHTDLKGGISAAASVIFSTPSTGTVVSATPLAAVSVLLGGSA